MELSATDKAIREQALEENERMRCCLLWELASVLERAALEKANGPFWAENVRIFSKKRLEKGPLHLQHLQSLQLRPRAQKQLEMAHCDIPSEASWPW